MKKYLSMFLIFCLISIFAAACAAEGASETPESLASVLESVDVDLMALSSTMVYAEIYNMMVSPKDYLGKTVKMSGPYYASYYDETGRDYHYVIVEDATACCQQGLEFIWNGGHIYPDEYPKDNTKIEVTGIFESYEELGHTYYCLAVDDITILK